jgi:oligopeptide transport system substrate-binding protein
MLGVAAAAVLGACRPRETEVQAATRAQTLLFAMGGEPNGLDPHTINSPADYIVVPALFEGLVVGDHTTLEATPGVAERWEVSPDGKVYTFHLRSNAKWSNGDPVTSADFLYSFQRALTPTLGSQYTFLFDAVAGATAFSKGATKDFATVGFAAPDAHTVRITLAQPTAYFLRVIANNAVWYPVHRATIERHGRMDQRDNAWTRPENFVGNGPFVLREWKPQQVLVAERAATYWDAANVKLRAIRFLPIESKDTQERAFRAGQLHVANQVPLSRLPVYREKTPQLLRERLVLISDFINLNTARPPFNDVRVRRALSLALRREPLVARTKFGSAAGAGTIVPPRIPGYVPPPGVPEDPAEARALLAQAGFPGGAGFPRLEYHFPAGADTSFYAALQETWRKELGIEIGLAPLETRVHWSELQAKNFVIADGAWQGDYADASTFLELWRTGNGWNFTNWSDARYDALLSAAAVELDPAARQRKLAEAEARLLDQLPVIPLYHVRQPELIDPSVHDWPDNVENRHRFNRVWLQSP